MKKWKRYLGRQLIRPTVYAASTRFMVGLICVLLARLLIKTPQAASYAALITAAVFALLSWIAYLRLDGIKLPKFMMLRVNPRKKPTRMYGDIIDYVDEQPQVTFEELSDAEKDICILGADLFCCVMFVIVSIFV